MKMRNTAFALLVMAAGFASAQVTADSASIGEREKSLFERIAKIEKKGDRFNLYFNMHYAFDADFNQPAVGGFKPGVRGFNQGAFNMHQFRIEAKGKVTDWLSYRWRQRLNRNNDGGGMIDNLPNSIDFACLTFALNKHLSISAGKQCAAYGGFEYDLNPIEIYRYSEMINNMSNFMSGVMLTYDITPDQQLAFQILDSRNGSIEDTYGTNLEANKLPLVYTMCRLTLMHLRRLACSTWCLATTTTNNRNRTTTSSLALSVTTLVATCTTKTTLKRTGTLTSIS